MLKAFGSWKRTADREGNARLIRCAAWLTRWVCSQVSVEGLEGLDGLEGVEVVEGVGIDPRTGQRWKRETIHGGTETRSQRKWARCVREKEDHLDDLAKTREFCMFFQTIMLSVLITLRIARGFYGTLRADGICGQKGTGPATLGNSPRLPRAAA